MTVSNVGNLDFKDYDYLIDLKINTDTSASYQDLYPYTDDIGHLKLHDKHDFNFPTVNVPFSSKNIPTTLPNGVY